MNKIKTLILCTVCFCVGFVVAIYFESPLEQDDKVYIASTDLKYSDDLQVQHGNKSHAKSLELIEDLTFDSDPIIKQLQNRVSQLEFKLQVKEEELSLALHEKHVQTRVNNPKDNDSQGTDKPKVISKEEAESALPKPFSNLIAGSTGTKAKDFYKFKEEPVDHDWGFRMEITIKDFVGMHLLSEHVTLESVICKTLTCEMRVFEQKDKSLSYILNDMKLQEWWDFTSSHSSSSSSTSKKYGQYFYILISKKA